MRLLKASMKIILSLLVLSFEMSAFAFDQKKTDEKMEEIPVLDCFKTEPSSREIINWTLEKSDRILEELRKNLIYLKYNRAIPDLRLVFNRDSGDGFNYDSSSSGISADIDRKISYSMGVDLSFELYSIFYNPDKLKLLDKIDEIYEERTLLVERVLDNYYKRQELLLDLYQHPEKKNPLKFIAIRKLNTLLDISTEGRFLTNLKPSDCWDEGL